MLAPINLTSISKSILIFSYSLNSWFKEVNDVLSIFISLKSKMFNFALGGPGVVVDEGIGSIS
jgi:hypothetical protein